MTLSRQEVCKRYYEKNKEKIAEKARIAHETGLYKERIEKRNEEKKEERKQV
jgi:hypothetical protein